ncbi:MAG: hypothetical protein JJ975_13385 [Bacteroidia bacterium]|nr:hypothetical protein [Bacteroidia bacterium]
MKTLITLTLTLFAFLSFGSSTVQYPDSLTNGSERIAYPSLRYYQSFDYGSYSNHQVEGKLVLHNYYASARFNRLLRAAAKESEVIGTYEVHFLGLHTTPGDFLVFNVSLGLVGDLRQNKVYPDFATGLRLNLDNNVSLMGSARRSSADLQFARSEVSLGLAYPILERSDYSLYLEAHYRSSSYRLQSRKVLIDVFGLGANVRF